MSLSALIAVSLSATSISVVEGNIVCGYKDDHSQAITSRGTYDSPALSPDGHTVAFVRVVRASSEPGDMADTEIWIGDCAAHSARRLVTSKAGSDVYGSFGGPTFSLDGHQVYFSAATGGSSTIIYRADAVSGDTRLVMHAELAGIIRNGPYAGDLLAGQHTCQPGGGCDYPYSLFTPAGKSVLNLPAGSENWDEKTLHAWLNKKGWRVW